jgi:putative phosphoribosyl transferase
VARPDAAATTRAYGRTVDRTSAAVFRDRREAGRRLAARVARFRREAPVVLALSRGGVLVAEEVAATLAAPLDLLVVHNLGEPGARVGAVAEGGIAVVDHDRAAALGLAAEQVARLREQAVVAVDDDARRFRRGAAPVALAGRTVLLVDDGVGSGDALRAASRAARRQGATRIVAAVPVTGAAALSRLGEELDEIVCVEVGPDRRWYASSAEISDADIAAALAPGTPQFGSEFFVPQAARGLVVLIGATEPVIRRLREMRFATFDLPETATERDLIGALDRLRRLPAVRLLGIGCFGFGGGVATALLTATRPYISALVLAGGRLDRALELDGTVRAPTLFVVGGEDAHMTRIARQARERCVAAGSQVAVVAGAGRSFTEPGALEQVALLAGGWFARQL